MKEPNDGTMWQKLLQWLYGESDGMSLPKAQLPKTGTNTEILLSSAEKQQLEEAIMSPVEREAEADTTVLYKNSASSKGDDSSLII